MSALTSASAAAKPSPRGRATRLARAASRMNALERSYAQQLDLLVRAGRLATWAFEALTFRLGFDLRYTPDFLLVRPDGEVELHDTKGTKRRRGTAIAYEREDARAKIRAAAAAFPFRFCLVYLDAGVWRVEEVRP